MADREIIIDMLNDALAKEIMAEKNCQQILNLAKDKKVKSIVKKIKNDELQHQELVKRLLAMI